MNLGSYSICNGEKIREHKHLKDKASQVEYKYKMEEVPCDLAFNRYSKFIAVMNFGNTLRLWRQ